MSPSEQRALIERYVDAYNRFAIDEMMETLHPDVEFITMSDGEEQGRASGAEAFRSLAERAAAAFAERDQVLTRLDRTDGRAVAHIHFQGVLARDLPNGRTAGEVIRVRGTSEFAFRDGRIVQVVDRTG